MWYDVSHQDQARRHSGPQTPFRLSLMRGLTVLVFAWMFLNVAGWGQLESNRPELPPGDIIQVNNYLDNLLAKARAAGPGYTSRYGAADFNQLAALSDAFQAYQGLGIAATHGSPAALALNQKFRYVHGQLSEMAHYNDQTGVVGMIAASVTIHNALREYRETHGTAQRPAFLPPPPADPGINWRHVAKRGVDGWLLAMIPAFLTILIGFRLRRESLWAELVERPWAPVLATVCWPLGLWAYAGEPGVIERRLQSLIDEYRAAHHTKPNEEWLAAQRLVLMRRARNLQDALMQIREYPELIRVNSRRAILATWLVAMLSGPIQMFLGVVQAYAQVARASGGTDSSLVDSTKVRRIGKSRLTGWAEGFAEFLWNGEQGRLSLARARGRARTDGGEIFLHLDTRGPQTQVLEAGGVRRFGRWGEVAVGRLTPPPVFHLPPPHKAFFRQSPQFGMIPSFTDAGVVATVRAGATLLDLGVLTGEGASGQPDHRTDMVFRLESTVGPATVSLTGQGPDEHGYGAALVTVSGNPGSVSYLRAERFDQDRTLDQVEITGRHGPWRAGLQLARERTSSAARTALLVLERSLGGFHRVMAELMLTEGGKPQYGFRLQHGLRLATP